MKELTNIMLDVFKPYYADAARWDNFALNVRYSVKEFGDVDSIDTERYPDSDEIRFINFRAKNGYPINTFEPRRWLKSNGNWQKEFPGEFDRVSKLLNSAKALRRAA